MNVHLLLLVLVVTTCYRVTIGSDYNTATVVLSSSSNNNTNSSNNVSNNSSSSNINSNNGKLVNNNNNNRNDEQKSSKITVDANSVVTSSEMQGATPKIEIEKIKSINHQKKMKNRY